MESLNEDVLIQIFNYLDDKSKLNLINASNRVAYIFATSSTLLRNFTLKVDVENITDLIEYKLLSSLPIKNLEITFSGKKKFDAFIRILNMFKLSLVHLELNNCKIENSSDFVKIFDGFENLNILKLNNCFVDDLSFRKLRPIASLQSIAFNNCNNKIFDAFSKQQALEKVTVSRNHDWTWNGFPHEIFNEICKNSKSLYHLVLNGAGTGSYFDCDEFPFKIRKLETTMISFHWYIGIQSARSNFLQSQKGFLKELTIHELPFDFDGGRVLRYIFEDMNLETLYYGETALILNNQKQEIDVIQASEIQVASVIEMIKQFPSCNKLKLTLNSTDIASDEIEKIINPWSPIYHNIKIAEIIDNSHNQYNLGTFLGLLKNLINVKMLKIVTEDININDLLEQFLPYMSNLKEFSLLSRVSEHRQRFGIIRTFAPNLERILVPRDFLETTRATFGNEIEIAAIEEEEE